MSSLTRTLSLLAAAAVVAALAAGSAGIETQRAGAATLAGDCTPGSDWGTPKADLATETIALVNAHRASLGRRRLVVSATLQAAAVWKARHMARFGYMSHNDPAPPVARSTGQRMQDCGYGASWGENIAYGYQSAQAVVDAWLASPGHRANIEDPGFSAIGSGVATGSGSIYWAHAFGAVADGGSPPPPLPLPPAPAPKTPAPKPEAPSPLPTKEQAGPVLEVPAGTVVLHNLTLDSSRPKAGKKLASRVAAFNARGRLKQGRVACHGRIDGRRVAVLVHAWQRGKATCVWRLPVASRGELVSAVVVVHQGRTRARAAFRAQVS